MSHPGACGVPLRPAEAQCLTSLALPTAKPVVFLRALDDVSAEEHGTLTLQCEVSSPEACVVWSKDGVELGPSDKRDFLQTAGTRGLVLHDLSCEDAGVYACRVGTEETRAHVSVHGGCRGVAIFFYPGQPIPISENGGCLAELGGFGAWVWAGARLGPLWPMPLVLLVTLGWTYQERNWVCVCVCVHTRSTWPQRRRGQGFLELSGYSCLPDPAYSQPGTPLAALLKGSCLTSYVHCPALGPRDLLFGGWCGWACWPVAVDRKEEHRKGKVVWNVGAGPLSFRLLSVIPILKFLRQ